MGEKMKIGDEVTFPLPRSETDGNIIYVNGIIMSIDEDNIFVKYNRDWYNINKDMILMKTKESVFWDKVINRIKKQNINTVAINHNICPKCAEENTLINNFWVNTGNIRCSNCGHIIYRGY